MVNGEISDHMSEGYRAIPDDGKNQDDSRDGTPGFDTPDEDPSETQDKNMDPFDPLNAPYVPGMTKEELFDLMTEKIVRQGDKITPDLKELMEMLSEKVIKYAEGKDINTDSNGGGSGEER